MLIDRAMYNENHVACQNTVQFSHLQVKWICGPQTKIFFARKYFEALGSFNPSITTPSCDGIDKVCSRGGTAFVHPGSCSYVFVDSGIVRYASACPGNVIAGMSRTNPSLILSVKALTSKEELQAENA